MEQNKDINQFDIPLAKRIYLNKPKSQDLELFKQKTIKIFIHGFLHLLGFNHIKNKDYFKMLREENFIYKHVKSKIN